MADHGVAILVSVGGTKIAVSTGLLIKIHAKLHADTNRSYKISEAIWEAFRATNLHFRRLTLGSTIKSM